MTSRKPPSLKFNSIQQSSVVDQIIDVFKDMLINGELRPGQRLPSETQLTQQLGVGRSALREAMKILKALGVVNIQQGNGTYVVDEPSPTLLSPLVFAILLEADMSWELVELRRLVEVGYCELAAINATEKDWANIEDAATALEEYAARPDAEVEVLARMDLDFHCTIIAAGHNPLVTKLANTVEELFFASIRNTYMSRPNNIETAARFHRDIMQAIRGGNPGAIRAAIETSLVHWREEVRKLEERKTQEL